MHRLKTAFWAILASAVMSVAAGIADASAQSAVRQTTIVYIDGTKYYVHTVVAGDTLYSLSRLYGVTVEDIVSGNPAAADGLRPDMTLKIPVKTGVAAGERSEQKKRRKDFEYHTVRAGETLYSISRSYGISIDTVLEDNPSVDPSQLPVGGTLYIRKTDMGKQQSAAISEEWRTYRDNMNAVAPDGYFYYIVQQGDTLYSLCRRYGVTEAELRSQNNLSDGLRAGDMLMLPLPEGRKAVDESVHEFDIEKSPAEAPEAPETVAGYGGESGRFRRTASWRPLRVALLLPLTKNGGTAVSGHYMDFYRGFLLGAEDVKAAGNSMEITLFDTEQNPAKTAEIVAGGFGGIQPDLIVGPVYENELAQVLSYAESHSVPVVSPLASLGSTRSVNVFQMSPDGGRKYDKAAELFDGSREVTLIYGESVDRDFESEVLSLLEGRRFATHKYVYEHQSVVERRERERARQGIGNPNVPSGPGDMTYLMRGGRNNVFVILSDNETEVDRILAAIASADISLRTRERTVPRFVVLGSSKWQRYATLDHSVFFSDKVIMLTSYSARRDDERVRAFDDRHISDFGSMPSLYTYRGYDAAVIFGNGMFGDIEHSLLGKRYRPLQTGYTFERRTADGCVVNTEWMRIDHRDNYTIKVE